MRTTRPPTPDNTWTSDRLHAGHGVPQPVARATRRRTSTATTRGARTRSRRACRRTSSSSIRPSTTTTSPTAARSATTTRCRSTCGAGCRRASRPSVNYQYALEGGSAFLGFAYGRVMNPSDQRASRDQDAVGLDDPGRPRSALRDRHAPGARRHSSAAGRSTASAASRRAMVNFGNVNLVGMSAERRAEDVQARHPHRPGERAADGLHDAGRRHPEHASCLQRQPEHGGRLQHGAGRARRPLLRAGQQRDLHHSSRPATARRGRS